MISPWGVGEEGGLGEFLRIFTMREARNPVPEQIRSAGRSLMAHAAEAARASIVAEA